MAHEKPQTALRCGWTTGACATAATRAAAIALQTGSFPRTISIRLPRGEEPEFALALTEQGDGWARAGIIKDAGDDPDVTHGVTVISTVHRETAPHGISFLAGPGVGTITRAGLPLAPGEPAINPAPRQMISQVLQAEGIDHARVEISIPGGEKLAAKTWNPRLGILGGLSVLGTTGIVHPFSCSAWIASIQRGIDVARANGCTHLAGATGSTSEAAVRAFHNLQDISLIDMGDFVGGMLKYLARHPVPRVTIAGGFGKMVKLSQGALDLHSGRSQVDMAALARLAQRPDLANANSALEVLTVAGPDLAGLIATGALAVVRAAVEGRGIMCDVLIVNRAGHVIAHAE